MKQFIKSTLTGSGTGLSSKRLFLFGAFTAWLGELAAWYFLHMAPNDVLATQLFTLLLGALTTVFGEPFMDSLKINAQKKLDDSNKVS